jgi:Protein of unknown function (DUF2652)
MAEKGGHTWQEVKEAVGGKLPIFFSVFAGKVNELARSNMCRCPACKGVSELRLKIICHVGAALRYRVAGFDKLSGPDVILVQRLLKNAIPVREYLCLTEPAHREIGAFMRGEEEAFSELIEEFGPLSLFVRYMGAPRDKEMPPRRAALPARVKQTMAIAFKGMLFRAGLKKGPTLRNAGR